MNLVIKELRGCICSSVYSTGSVYAIYSIWYIYTKGLSLSFH